MLFVVQDREKDILSKEDIPNICRLCLRSDYLMRNIFSTENYGTKPYNPDDTISNKIKRSFQLDVSFILI